MAILTDIFALSRAYPLISVIIGAILFFIGLKVTAKLIKWILWILAAIALIAAFVMLFL
ncbi:hypothetical protein J4429_05015 [Candidatus Pacearchaeota archaeon]|nr:hypothetical protein [Candidatus Pacearchaeota archaeon]